MKILPRAFPRVQKTYIFVRGAKKGRALKVALCDPTNFKKFPVLLARGAEIRFDTQAYGEMRRVLTKDEKVD